MAPEESQRPNRIRGGIWIAPDHAIYSGRSQWGRTIREVLAGALQRAKNKEIPECSYDDAGIMRASVNSAQILYPGPLVDSCRVWNLIL